MDYSKALKKRDELELELKGIQWKVNNADKIKTNTQSWYYKKETDYIKFLKENNLIPVNITLTQRLDERE